MINRSQHKERSATTDYHDDKSLAIHVPTATDLEPGSLDTGTHAPATALRRYRTRPGT